jgi:hypothetical protein
MKRVALALFLCLIAIGARAAESRISVDPVAGAPPPHDAAIARKVASELEHLGYETASAAPLRLSGKAIAVTTAVGAHFTVVWSLSDAGGRALGQFTTVVTAPYRAADPWDALDADSLGKLAKATAEEAERKLEGTDAGAAPVASSASESEKPVKEKSAPNPAIATTKVFIVGVSGAPGDGNIALPNALAGYFSQFDIELLPAKSPDAYVIEGKVSVAPKNASEETVKILWLLRSPKGKELARIAQENAVAAGSLDPHWGKNAEYAAEGAADGLLSTMARLGLKPPVN